MQSLVEKYRPRVLADFIGLKKQKAILAKLAESPWPSAWLLVGDSGTGKTTMALAVAEAMGGEVQHVASRQCDLETVQRVTERCWYAPMFGRYHVILVDEADQMTKAAQHAFLSKLDTTEMPPQTVFIFTANQTGTLEDRFQSRCRVLKFDSDGMESDAVSLMARIWAAEGLGAFREPDHRKLYRAAGGNVRSALMALELEMLAPEDKPAPIVMGKYRWVDVGGGRMAALPA